MNNLINTLQSFKINKENMFFTATCSSVDPLQAQLIPSDDSINLVNTNSLVGIEVGSRLLLIKYLNQFIPISVIASSPYPVGWTYYKKKSNDTSRTSTTASDDTELSLSVPRNGIYRLDAFFAIDGDDNTTDIKIGWTNSGITELTRRCITAIGTSSTSTSNAETMYSNSYAFVSEAPSGVTSSEWTTRQEVCIIRTSTSDGTVTPRWGCNSSSGTVTVKSFSFVTLTKVANY